MHDESNISFLAKMITLFSLSFRFQLKNENNMICVDNGMNDVFIYENFDQHIVWLVVIIIVS